MKLIYSVAAEFVGEKVKQTAMQLKKDNGIAEPCRVMVRKVKKNAEAETEHILCLLPVSMLPADKDAADTLLAKFVVDCQAHYRRQFTNKGEDKNTENIV